MRRALSALAGTAALLAMVLGYKSGPPPTRTAVRPGPTPSGIGADDDSAGPAPAPSAPSTDAPSTTAAPSPAGRSGRFTGPVVETRFGPVQVQVVFQNGRLADVRAVETPTDRARSAYISSQAAPILRQEALDAQSANIDVVSGATYTSEGYAQSLQAALDAARR
jgi:uncharacterized protein with FMN-binding domain